MTDGERAVWAAAFVADLQYMGHRRREAATYVPDGPWGTIMDDVSSAAAVAQSVVEMLRDVAVDIAEDYPTALEMVGGEHTQPPPVAAEEG